MKLRYNSQNLQSTLSAAHTQATRTIVFQYVYNTGGGFAIANRPPDGCQPYYQVEPDGTIEYFEYEHFQGVYTMNYRMPGASALA